MTSLQRLTLYYLLATALICLSFILHSCFPAEPGGNPTPVPQIQFYTQPDYLPSLPQIDRRRISDQSQPQPTPGYDGYCRSVTSHLLCCYAYTYEPTPRHGPPITPRITGTRGVGCQEVP